MKLLEKNISKDLLIINNIAYYTVLTVLNVIWKELWNQWPKFSLKKLEKGANEVEEKKNLKGHCEDENLQVSIIHEVQNP